jgi:hypothetical protein
MAVKVRKSGAWVDVGGSAVAGTTKVAVLEDQKTSGTAGGNFDTGAWRDRTLNTETDPQTFVTLDSGNVYFSLAAGTYEIGWSAPATAVDNHQTRLVYATDTAFSSGVGYVYGSSEQSDQNEGQGGASTIINDTRSFGTTVQTTSVTTYFKIQHRCATSSVGSGGNTRNWGMGKPSSFSGDSQLEVYTQVKIEDLATAVKTASTGMSYTTKTGAYTLVVGDDQKLIATDGQINVNQNIFSPPDAITIYNNSASSITIAQGTGVTLRLVGTSTTGNRTLLARGIATIVCVVNNEFVVSGGGLT